MNDLRICKICSLTKGVGEFPTNHHLYRHPQCKSCKNAYQRSLRKAKPDIYKSMDARRRSTAGFKQIAAKRNKTWREADLDGRRVKDRRKMAIARARIDAFKNSPCVDCGISYPPYVMDFDHVRGEKEFNISKMRHYSMDRILEEIAKCDLVCANCHRIRTFQRLQDKTEQPKHDGPLMVDEPTAVM